MLAYGGQRCKRTASGNRRCSGSAQLSLIFAKGVPGAFAPRRRPLATTSPVRMAQSFCGTCSVNCVGTATPGGSTAPPWRARTTASGSARTSPNAYLLRQRRPPDTARFRLSANRSGWGRGPAPRPHEPILGRRTDEPKSGAPRRSRPIRGGEIPAAEGPASHGEASPASTVARPPTKRGQRDDQAAARKGEGIEPRYDDRPRADRVRVLEGNK